MGMVTPFPGEIKAHWAGPVTQHAVGRTNFWPFGDVRKGRAD